MSMDFGDDLPIIQSDETKKYLHRFGIADYTVFVLMLVFCSLVGVYFGYYQKTRKASSRRKSIAVEYLMGGRDMQIFPVSMSLVATFISGITLLGTPTEVYLYGTQFCYILIALVFIALVMHFEIIPVFHDLQITSTYEYLQARFDRNMRLFGAISFSIATILWLPIVIYVPALAFNQVTGVNIHIITPIVCIVCIFYTLVGGMKAVVWTDVIQTVIMFGSLILIVVKGTMDVGGLSVVIQKNYDSGRIEAPDFDVDPTVRHTVWTTIIGGTIYWGTINSTSQSYMQRYLALKTVKSAQRALLIFMIGLFLMISLCCYNGLLIYATYYDCDPLTTKLAKAKDQLLPLLVMDILKNLPGLPGLFIAGIFSAALSSLSTGMNSMAAVVLEDFYKPFAKRPLTERQTGFLMRGTVFFIGIVSVGLVFVVQHLGAVQQLSMSLSSATYGPMLGVYICGLAIPWINTRGTLLGALTGLITMMYISIKAQVEIAAGAIFIKTKPLTTDGCTYDFINMFSNITAPNLEADEKSLHNLSYLYYTLFGAIITCLVALIYSMIFGFRDPESVDPALLAPFLRRYFKPKDTLSKQPDKERELVLHAF